MKLSNELGKCPYCGSEELDYGAMEPADEMIYYPWTCSHCGKQGEEWYSMKFIGHNVENESGNMEEVEEINRRGGI